MQPISPNYRSDAADGLSPEIKKYLDKVYLPTLDNLNRTNPKLLVAFSGGNAVGKSTISQKISEELGGIVLENDAVKLLLLKLNPEFERAELNKMTWQYTMDFYTRLEDITANGLIVRDGVIDWYYDRILPAFEKAGYDLFIVGFDVSRKKTIDLIKNRGDTPTVKEDRFYAIMDGHEIHIKRFRALYKPDITLTDENIFDQKLVLDALEQRLTELTQCSSITKVSQGK